MKSLILFLIIASFLQSTVLPVDLVLIILICRSYLISDKSNLFLAFFFGLLDSHLNLNILGLQSLTYLIAVEATQGLSKSRLAGNSLLIIPLSFILLYANILSLTFFTHQTPQIFPKIFLMSFLSLPVLYFIRLWEERFIVRKEIKLKV